MGCDVAFCTHETEAGWHPDPAPPRSNARCFAHAVRNPLNGAKLHLELLERELAAAGATPEAYQSLRWIESQIDRVAELVAEYVEASGGSSDR